MKDKSASSAEARTETPESTQPAGNGPIDAIIAGAKDAQAAIANSTVSWSSALYRVAYSVSYGVVYGTLALTSWIPVPAAVAKGIHDGACAAEQDFTAAAECSVSITGGPTEAGLANA